MAVRLLEELIRPAEHGPMKLHRYHAVNPQLSPAVGEPNLKHT